MELILYSWTQVQRACFVLAVLELQRPVVGLTVYAGLFLAAACSTWIGWKHFKAGRRLLAGTSMVLAVVFWSGLGLAMNILLETVLWLARQ